MSRFRIRISAWIALTAYGLASFTAQLLHDHSHHAPLSAVAAHQCDVAAHAEDATAPCPCGLPHDHPGEDSPAESPGTPATLLAHAHCGHSHHNHHPSHDEGECPTCRYLAVKPAATTPVVAPRLPERVEPTAPCVVLAPDVPALLLPSPRGPPIRIG